MPWWRRSGRSRARPTSSAPSPTRSPSIPRAGRSTSPTHAERGRRRRLPSKGRRSRLQGSSRSAGSRRARLRRPPPPSPRRQHQGPRCGREAVRQGGAAPDAQASTRTTTTARSPIVPVPEKGDSRGSARRCGATSDASGSRGAPAAAPRPAGPRRARADRRAEPRQARGVRHQGEPAPTISAGDVEAGNGDPRLCIFGERTTPNQHKLAREFVLLDNTYCAGISARRPPVEHHRHRHRLPGALFRGLAAQLPRRMARTRPTPSPTRHGLHLTTRSATESASATTASSWPPR